MVPAASMFDVVQTSSERSARSYNWSALCLQAGGMCDIHYISNLIHQSASPHATLQL